MKTPSTFLALVALAASAGAQPPRHEWFRGLSLESSTRQAELVLAARVENVAAIRIVRGGKGESETHQFTFKPLRVLKGVFARPELILTSDDLAGYRLGGELKQIKAGQTRVLFLGRNDTGYRNAGFGEHETTLDHSMPPVAGGNDPLLDSIATLLAVEAGTDRIQRVALLSEAIGRSPGPAAVPLLNALPSRAVLAAQHPACAKAIAGHLADPSPAVRTAAASALRALLAADYLRQPALHEQAAAWLATALAGDQPNIAARSALLAAVGELGGPAHDALIARLDFDQPGLSIAERQEQIEAAGKLRAARLGDQLFALSGGLPVDSPQMAGTEIALARVDAARGAAEIERHLRGRIAGGLDGADCIRAVPYLPSESSVPLLLRILSLPLDTRERQAAAQAADRICEGRPDERLVAPLAELRESDDPYTRGMAVQGLLRIGSPAAAKALRAHLPREQQLERKLRIAELLGRHGMNDGYAYAIEHVSEPHLTDRAVAALVAMNDPRAVAEARKILETSNDRTWNSAAVRVLGALGTKDLAPKFLGYVADWKNPLAPSALLALADLGEAKVLPRVHDALGARNDDIVIAGARAAGRLLARPGISDEALREKLSGLLADASASEPVRAAALDALRELADPRLDRALAVACADAGLERTGLMSEIERLLRERKIRLP